MDTGSAEKFIGESQLFKGLRGDQIREIVKISSLSLFKKGEIVFSEGEEAGGFYLLKSGHIKIYKISFEGKEQILHLITPGEPFGEAPVFAGEKFPANAEALIDSEAFFFSRQAFIELVTRDPTIALNMLALLSRRLRQFAQLVENLSLKEVPQRLATYFLSLSENKGHKESLELNISKGQLASILGTIPETLSRVLSKMVNHYLIRVQGRTIIIMDRKGLEALASGETVL
ncbi:MAG: Crp/Fnr family transcriptional regulator [Syntrophorhabdaceae bacterium]|nr:Crp/Fnr family transcriptional regulator [Syntrophorhabdaceae bacterium]